MKKYLVIDAGGTAVKYALMNESAKILERGKFPTPGYVDHTLEDFLQRLDVVVEKYQKQIEGIAVSMPGMLDSRKGYCVTGGMLAYFSTFRGICTQSRQNGPHRNIYQRISKRKNNICNIRPCQFSTC